MKLTFAIAALALATGANAAATDNCDPALVAKCFMAGDKCGTTAGCQACGSQVRYACITVFLVSRFAVLTLRVPFPCTACMLSSCLLR